MLTLARHHADLDDLILGQLRRPAPLPTVSCAVLNSIHLVLNMSCPTQMVWVDATQMTVSARMCRLKLRIFRLTMGQNTHDTRCRADLSAPSDSAPPMAVAAERPQNAVVAVIFQMIRKKLHQRTFGGCNAMRVACFLPPIVMHRAHIPRRTCFPVRVFLAPFDATCFEGVSHIRSFRDRSWLGPAGASNTASGPFTLHERPCLGKFFWRQAAFQPLDKIKRNHGPTSAIYDISRSGIDRSIPRMHHQRTAGG